MTIKELMNDYGLSKNEAHDEILLQGLQTHLDRSPTDPFYNRSFVVKVANLMKTQDYRYRALSLMESLWASMGEVVGIVEE